MRIIDRLVTYIESNSGLEITDVDSFYTESSERFMLRQDPSAAVETRYFDGSRTGHFAYSVYAKSMDPQTAVSDLFTLEKLLDIPAGLQLHDVQVIENVIVQSAHFVAKTDKNEKIYVSSFMLNYYTED